MNAPSRSILKKRPFPATRGLLFCVFVLTSLLPANEALAVRPFQRLRRGFDAIRPGWIIPHENQPLSNNTQSAQPKPPKKLSSSKQKDAASPKPDEPKRDSEESPSPTLAEVPDSEAKADLDAAETLEQTVVEAPDEFGVSVESQDGHLTIIAVDPEGAGHAAGLEVGDSISGVGGISVESVETIETITDGLDAGAIVEFEIVRDEKEMTKPVQFGTFRPTTAMQDSSPNPVSEPQIESPIEEDALVPSPSVDHTSTVVPPAPTPQEIEAPSLGSVLVPDAVESCLLYTSPSPRDKRQSRMPSSA